MSTALACTSSPPSPWVWVAILIASFSFLGFMAVVAMRVAKR